jgi:PAS domain S-box-containing protein
MLGDGVAVIDADGIVRSLNPAGERLLQADASFLVGKKLLDTPWRTVNEDGTRRPREDHPALVALRTGEAQLDARVGLLRPDGDVAWIAVTAVPLENPEGGPPLGVIVSFRDVSRRRKMELALESSQRTLDLIFNATSDFIFLVAVEYEGDAPRFRYEEVNAAYARIVGRPREEIVNRRVDEVLTAERYASSRLLLEEAAKTGESIRRTAVDFPGGRAITDITIRVIDQANGRACRLLGAGRDVTRQAASEAELRASEERFRAMAESMGEGVAITDLADCALYVNDRLVSMTGYPREELVGRILADILFTPAGRAEVGRRTAERVAGVSTRYQVEMVRKNGEHRWVEIGGAPFRDAHGAIIGTVGTITDITERHSVDEARAQIVGIVSHELRTPLTALSGSLKLLEREVARTGSDAQAVRLVELANRNAQRMLGLVNDLLDLERLESGGGSELALAAHAIATLTGEAAEIVAPIADERRITIGLDATDAIVRADADRIKQVLINLIGNAIKFSPDGGHVAVGASRRGAFVDVYVRDQGRGIPADRLPLLFQRFSQVHVDDSRRKKGAGLGLAISRAIVKQHGGRIWAESPPSGGAVFRFTLPAAGG